MHIPVTGLGLAQHSLHGNNTVGCKSLQNGNDIIWSSGSHSCDQTFKHTLFQKGEAKAQTLMLPVLGSQPMTNTQV